MALLKRCCCGHSVRTGSFASGFYTLILYIFILTGAAFHVSSIFNTYHLLIINLVMVIFYVSCVVSSIVLLIGLVVDSKGLLVPWIIIISLTTLLDIILSLYIFIDTFDTFMATLFSLDIIIWVLNIYCLLCVFSQFQEYRTDRALPQDEPQQIIEAVEQPEENCCIPCAIIRETVVVKPGVVGTSHVSADTLVISANYGVDGTCEKISDDVKDLSAEDVTQKESSSIYECTTNAPLENEDNL